MKTRLDDQFCLASNSLQDMLTHSDTERQINYSSTL